MKVDLRIKNAESTVLRIHILELVAKTIGGEKLTKIGRQTRAIAERIFVGLYLLFSAMVFFVAKMFPIKNIAVLNSYSGRLIDDSVSWLGNLIEEQRPTTKVRVIKSSSVRRFIKLFRFDLISIKSVFWLCTCKIVVSNTELPIFFQKRNGQKYLQLWHGTSIKRLGFDREGNLKDLKYSRLLEKDAAAWDLAISSGKYETEIIRSAFHYRGPIAEIGSIRLLAIKETKAQFAEKTFGSDHQRVILYAPSWREDAKEAFLKFDPANTVKQLCSHFPKNLILYKPHHNFSSLNFSVMPKNLKVLNSQEILSSLFPNVDLLVSDYSSVVFDFGITERPFLFYIPDFDEYNISPGVYIDLKKDFASLVATDFEQLAISIEKALIGDNKIIKSCRTLVAFQRIPTKDALVDVLDEILAN